MKSLEDFINNDFARAVAQARLRSDEENLDIIRAHPNTVVVLAALIDLIEQDTLGVQIDLDDWECDFADVLFPEVQKLTKK